MAATTAAIVAAQNTSSYRVKFKQKSFLIKRQLSNRLKKRNKKWKKWNFAHKKLFLMGLFPFGASFRCLRDQLCDSAKHTLDHRLHRMGMANRFES